MSATPKVLYYLELYVACVYCRYVLSYIDDSDWNPSNLHIRKTKCENINCPQFNKVFEVKPLEAEVIDYDSKINSNKSS
jgi:hypothetical protein